MKTLNEIQLAMCRTLMRHGALMYREAISPQFGMNWNYRCKLGVESLLFAMSQRNEARLWEAEAAKEKKLQRGLDNGGAICNDSGQREPEIRPTRPDPARPSSVKAAR